MKNNEIQKLVDIRTFLIHKYNNLDGRTNAGTAVVLQKDVAYTLEQAIKGLDSLLSTYVEIKKI